MKNVDIPFYLMQSRNFKLRDQTLSVFACMSYVCCIYNNRCVATILMMSLYLQKYIFIAPVNHTVIYFMHTTLKISQ
jgi:hypothetical protein